MVAISKEKKGIYLKEALRILKEHGGEYPSSSIINEMSQRLVFSDYEKSLNDSGYLRWVTRFRFHSIGLVKAGWIVKDGRIWRLTKSAENFEELTPEEIIDFVDDAYDKWDASRTNNKSSLRTEIEESEEPEVLMQVKPDDISFQDLIAGISSTKIQIPPFQRSFVWEPSDIRFLLDSIYRGYPIGSFIFWKTIRKLPSTRTIGDINLKTANHSPGTEISYVLDGQQRITSLFAAVKGSAIDKEHYRFLFDLRKKKFIVGRAPSSQNKDFQTKDVEELQISIGVIFTESRATYRNIIRQYPEEYESILDTLYDRFVGYRFSVIQVIDPPVVDIDDQSNSVRQVVNMFSRINETGRKLTVVAKMVARCWGEGFDLRESLDAFYATDRELNSIREETLLQAASVILNYKKARSQDILIKTNISKLDSEWDNIIHSFLLAIEFIKIKMKIKNLEYLPFDAVLVPLSYIFYINPVLDFKQSELIEKWFWRTCLSNRYGSTLEAKLEEDCILFDSIIAKENPAIDFLIDWESMKNNLIAQPYNLRNAFVKTVLALYSFADPKNLVDGRSMSLDKVFSGYYKHNLHHIFPQAYLRRNEPEQKELFNSIVNIMFIPSITNLEISDKDPKTYFSRLGETNDDFQKILMHHYIYELDKSGLLENNFLKFLDYRANQIVQAFRIRTGIGSPSEELFTNDPATPIDILESQLRNFIHEVLSNNSESSYWHEYIPSDLKESVNRKIQEDIKRHPYKLDEYDKDDVRLNYLDIMDYAKIISSNWQFFKVKFGSLNEVNRHFLSLKYYRNPIKHGRALNEVDKRNGEAAVLWLESIFNNHENQDEQ